MSHFTITEPLADVFHIQDAGQVCFTLIRGAQDTLLWDTGMGFYDVAECIAPYVRGKLHVVLIACALRPRLRAAFLCTVARTSD